MNPPEFDTLLTQTLGDEQLSRSEKQILSELLAEERPDDQKLAQFRARAFAVARENLADPQAHKTLGWLEEVVKLLQKQVPPAFNTPTASTACFAPGDNCPAKIVSLIAAARQKIDVCVFTVTDDRLSDALLVAYRRGVVVRIITDNEKFLELGSDITRLAGAGLAVKVDMTPYHMHHKFALFDDRQLLAGSYNWTRGAAEKNHESFIITSDVGLVTAFHATFEKLWRELADFSA